MQSVHLDGREHVGRDVVLDKRVYQLLIKGKVREVSATLSVILDVLCILEHGKHEFDSLLGCHLFIEVEHLSHVCQ